MTKSQLIKAVAKDRGLSAVEIGNTLESIAKIITAEVRKGEPVHWNDLGVFRNVIRAARMARNPSTGVPVAVPRRSALVLRVRKELRDL